MTQFKENLLKPHNGTYLFLRLHVMNLNEDKFSFLKMKYIHYAKLAFHQCTNTTNATFSATLLS